MTKRTIQDDEWCPNCGDVKACQHFPNDVVMNAWWSEWGPYVDSEERGW